MRFTVDENVPLLVATALTSLGHDCFVIARDAHRAPDENIMAFSRREERILVTFDSDFSRMIFHELQPPARRRGLHAGTPGGGDPRFGAVPHHVP